jgi:glyoxylase-like metal-dependent hydrolase (beta-lactamase superfamily II)
VWSIPLPFPNPLGYTLTYSIQVDRGFILVDLGWDSPEAWDALLAGLRLAGARPRNVLGAVITHIHPDHFGLASRLKETSDAWLAVHPAELSHIAVDDSARDRFMQQMSEWLQSCGCPPSEFSALAIDAPEVRARLSSILPDVLLTDNEEVP